MKTFLKIILGIVLLFVLGIAAVFYMTRGMASVADDFLSALQQRDMEKAGEYLSEAFKQSTSIEEVAVYAEQYRLFDYSDSSWNSRSFNGGNGEISGSMTTTDGGTVPLTIHFVKENGDWKIYHIEKPSSGISDDPIRPEIPPEEELVDMVRHTMTVFAQSISEKSMSTFYDSVSSLWRMQTTPEQLDAAFQLFIEREYNFTVLENYSPQFTSTPAIDDDGALNIIGVYQLEENQVHFEQNYIYEGLSWKLFGININIK